MNKYIQKLIQELFNIGNMDLTNNKSKRNMNIFNKEIYDPNDIYDKLLKNIDVLSDEIKYLNKIVSAVKIESKNRDVLQNIYKIYCANYPYDSMNWIDVSDFTDFSKLFLFTSRPYYGNISKWDVSNVKSMKQMFKESKFNGNISGWDVSNVIDMSDMFCNNSAFTGDISMWNVSNVRNMAGMFDSTLFNGDISRWDVSNVTNMHSMFAYSKFNGDISGWDVSNVTDMSNMFHFAKFNNDISLWNVSNVLKYKFIFFLSKIKKIYKPARFR